MAAWAVLTSSLLALYLATSPLVMSQLRAAGGSARAVAYVMLSLEPLRWGVLVYFLVRGSVALGAGAPFGGGFELAKEHPRLGRTVLLGLAVGLVAAVVGGALQAMLNRIGVLPKPIWVQVRESGLPWVGVLGALRNLAGEEVPTRLGVQVLLLHHLGNRRGGRWLALLGSALWFELWHNGLHDLYFVNFAVSAVLAYAFQRLGYEVAALGHFSADLVLVAALPAFLA